MRQTEFKATTLAHHIYVVKPDSRAHKDPSLSKWVSKAKPKRQLLRVPLEEASPEKIVALGADLEPKSKEKILEVLHSNEDIFTWVPKTSLEWLGKPSSTASPSKQRHTPRSKSSVKCR